MEQTTKGATHGCASFTRQITNIDHDGIVEHVPGNFFRTAIRKKEPKRGNAEDGLRVLDAAISVCGDIGLGRRIIKAADHILAYLAFALKAVRQGGRSEGTIHSHSLDQQVLRSP